MHIILSRSERTINRFERQLTTPCGQVNCRLIGDHLFNIPIELITSGLFLEGDDVAFSIKHNCITIKNLSCIQLRVSRFRRNINSIMKNITNNQHPLNRVLVKVKGKHSSFWVIPYDKADQRAYFLEMNFKKKRGRACKVRTNTNNN
jgi:hypothetical protein